MRIRRIAGLLTATACALGGGAALAQDLRIGLIHIDPSTKSDGIQGTNALGKMLTASGPGASIGKASTLLITYEHWLGEHLGAEIVLGIPPKHDVLGAGSLKPGEKIGSLRQLSPALLLNYHFAGRQATWRPTLGAGLLYSTISDIKIDPAAQPQTTATADKGIGVAMHAALAYAIDSHWHVVGALGLSRVKNKISLSTDTSKPPYTQLGLPAGVATSEINVRTTNTTLSLSLGYSF